MKRRLHRIRATAFKRPFATYYYGDDTTDEDAYAHSGSSKSEEGAVRAAVFRLIIGQYALARLYSRDTGALLREIAFTPEGHLVAYWGRRARA
jgi:hypothetical protein